MGEDAPATILVVDDDETLCEILVNSFRLLGMKAVGAGDGQEALKIIRSKQNVDVILSDVRMPIMDGLELLRTVQDSKLSIPVMLMTGFSDFSDDELYKKGAKAVFAKPFAAKQVFDMLAKVLPA